MENKEKTISKIIQEIIAIQKHRSQPKQVFDDIIQLTFNIVFHVNFQSHHPTFDITYKVDENLINELSDYKNNARAWELLQEAVKLFIRLFAENEPFSDVLGSQYDEYLGSALGQFFTPNDVALLTAELGLDSNDKAPESIADVCGCGAGSLILAQLYTCYKKIGKDSLKETEVIGMDLDIRMVQLTALQIVLNSMLHKTPIKSLSMHHGNALTDYNDAKTEVITWIPELKSNNFDKKIDVFYQITKTYKD